MVRTCVHARLQEYVSSYQLLILKVDRIPFPIAFYSTKKKASNSTEESLFSVLKLNILKH